MHPLHWPRYVRPLALGLLLAALHAPIASAQLTQASLKGRMPESTRANRC